MNLTHPKFLQIRNFTYTTVASQTSPCYQCRLRVTRRQSGVCFSPDGLYRQVQCCGDSLDQEPDDHHVVNNPFLAGVVSQDRHEGK